MSIGTVMNGPVNSWVVAKNNQLIPLRMLDQDIEAVFAAAHAMQRRFVIRRGAAPFKDARIPQEWLIYDVKWVFVHADNRGRKHVARQPVKRLFSATIDAALVWCVHMQEAG